MPRRLIICVAVALIALAMLLFGVPILLPWTPLNCEHQDIDIMTGRLRFTRYRLFCKVSERIEDSPLSKILPAGMVSAAKPEWHRVNTFSPGVGHSPHYLFHSAIHQISTLSAIWEMPEIYGLPEALKQQTALHVLALWQHDGSDSLADEYIQCLVDVMGGVMRQQILQALPTLQMPLVETRGSQVVRTVFFPTGQTVDRIHGYVDASRTFIRHGVWEQWWPDGKRSLYGHFENGAHQGRRFEWDRVGRLIAIEAFSRGHLCEYESENLEQHPDYRIAQQLLARDGLEPGP